MGSLRRIFAGTLLGAGALTLARHTFRRQRAISLAGRSVVLMGASRGLGLAIARELVREGAAVTLAARDPEELERARQMILQVAPEASVTVIPCDVADRERVEWVIDESVRIHGGIDGLINLASMVQLGPIDHMSLEDFRLAMDVHFWGALYATTAAVRHMRERGGGRIVNIVSIGGRIAVPHLAPYTASKFALTGLSNTMRAELDRDGIRVTTVLPGLMRTGSIYGAQVKGYHETEFAWFALLDAMPLLSVSARRAARRIIEALRHGDRHVVIGVPARLAMIFEALAPGLFGDMMALANRLMPGRRPDGAETRTGWESHSRAAPSLFTRPVDRAAVEYNQLGDHAPEDLLEPRREERTPRPAPRSP